MFSFLNSAEVQMLQMPETYETIEFNDNGICNICTSAEFKKENIDWVERKKLLDNLIEKHRGKQAYDCIVPFSGGKDSTFTLLYLMREYNLKPLVVRFNHGFYRDTITRNGNKTLKKLGVDFIEFTPNWHMVKRLMLESFKRKTDFCWHCHTGIYSYPLRIALLYKVPLIFWGEPQSEITSYYDYLNDEIEYEDDRKFNKLRTLGITAEDMFNMLNSPAAPVDIRDLTPYTFPAISELRELKYCSLPLGSFIPWDYKSNTEVIKEELGWEVDELEGVPASINPHGEKIECFMQGTRDYVKYLKRGYGRVAQISAFEARAGRISAAEALQRGNQYDGKRPQSLALFLDYVGLTEVEFNEFVKQTVVPPNVFQPGSKGVADPVWDLDDWFREQL
jgi:N-acetyl sugar amidotransferase